MLPKCLESRKLFVPQEMNDLMIDQQKSSVLGARCPDESELFQRRQDYEGSGNR